jgi:hypothetical protein
LPEVRARLREARWALRIYQFAANAATFGQLIVGGLLTSQFVQEQIGKNLIGLMGAITLASALLQRHYQFGARAAAADSDVFELRRLIRELEDALKELPDSELDRKNALSTLRRSASAQLNEVDRPEGRPLTPPPRYPPEPEGPSKPRRRRLPAREE